MIWRRRPARPQSVKEERTVRAGSALEVIVPDLLDLANTPARRGAPALSRVNFGRSLNGSTLDVAPVLTRLPAMRTNVHHSNER